MISKWFFSKCKRIDITNKRGIDILRDPVYNKCIFLKIAHGFTMDERDRLGLRGLLMDKIAVKF